MSTYHHGHLRTAVLRAAGKQLEKEGVAGLSLREVARRAGVSHNAPYRHFPDRDALLSALAEEGFEMLSQSLKGKSGRDVGDAYVAFVLANPQRYRLMFGGLRGFEAHRAIHSAFEQAFEGQGVDPKLAAAAAWSLVHGLSHLLLDGHFPNRTESFVKDVIASVRFSATQRSA